MSYRDSISEFITRFDPHEFLLFLLLGTLVFASLLGATLVFDISVEYTLTELAAIFYGGFTLTYILVIVTEETDLEYQE